MTLPIDLARLLAGSNRRQHIGRSVEILDETDSTNDRGHESSRTDGHVIAAEYQTSGRGQRGRVWSAPRSGCLLFSIVLSPPAALGQANFLTAWAAAGLAEVLSHHQVDARIKWPNDLLIRHRKVAGILVERRQITVVGMGVNVSVKPDEFPDNLRMPATSLETETGSTIDRTELFQQLLDRLDAIYADAYQNGASVLWPIWQRYVEDLIDRPVLVSTRREQFPARLLSIHPERGARVVRQGGMTTLIPPEELVRLESPASPPDA